jgi:putative flippase GtrA
MNEARTSAPGLRQFAGFVVVGGLAALVNIAARLALNPFTRFEVAVILAYCVGVAVAFVLNRYFVFHHAPSRSAKAFVRFVGVNLVALAQVYAVSVLLARLVFPAIGFTFQAETIAHILGVASPVLTSFVLHKHYTFAA